MFRLLDHGPCPPAWNMAVDCALWRSHAENGGPPTIRFYQWVQPTLSVGAGQKLPPDLTKERLEALGWAFVRRPSGGRAVLHGGDLTYSVVAGQREGFPPSVRAVYRRLCRGLQAGLAQLGITASTGTPSRNSRKEFHCFAWISDGDLSFQGKKFAGGAQVWRSDTFLQHGSIMVDPPAANWQQFQTLPDLNQPFPPNTTCLSEILERPVSISSLKTALQQGLREELNITLMPGDLTTWEEDQLRLELEARTQQF